MPAKVFAFTATSLIPVGDSINNAQSFAVAFLFASANTTYFVPAGAVLAESVGTPGSFGLYDVANSDLSVARGIAETSQYIDDAGNALNSATPAFGNLPYKSNGMWVGGYFRIEDLKLTTGAGQITSAAITGLVGRVVSGTLAAGVGILKL